MVSDFCSHFGMVLEAVPAAIYVAGRSAVCENQASYNSINCQVKFQTILIKMTLPEIPMRREDSLPMSNDTENNDMPVHSPPPPYSSLAESNHIRHNYSAEQQSLMAGHQPDVEINPLHDDSVTNKQLLKQNKVIAQGKLTCYYTLISLCP